MAITTQPNPGAHLPPSFPDASVADVMTPGIISCAPGTPLDAVAELMATHRVHAVVVDGIVANHLVWGVIGSLQLVRALRDPDAAGNAEAISLQPVHAIEPDASLAEAARLMDERNVAHLVVVDRDRPIGVLSTLDVIGAAAPIQAVVS